MIDSSALTQAVFQLAVLGAIGYVYARFRGFSEASFTFLSDMVMMITTPALILTDFMQRFSFSFSPPWWLFFLLSIVFWIGPLMFMRFMPCSGNDACRPKETAMLTAFQNCGYLPIALISLAFTGGEQMDLLVYTFLYMFGFNFLIWSVGSSYIFKDKAGMSWQSMLNMPVLSVLAVFAIKFFGGAQAQLPTFLSTPLAMLGHATIPLSMFFLGAALAVGGAIPMTKEFVSQAMYIFVMKMLFIPFVAVVACAFMPHSWALLAFFIVLQAAMPPAVNVPMIVKMKNGDHQFSSQIVCIMHVAGIVTVPLWLNALEWARGLF